MNNENDLPNENQIVKAYEYAIEEIDLNGKYQKLVFFILAVTAFLCCNILVSFPIQKEIPDYKCFNRFDFEDLDEFKIYKNTSKYKIIHSEECIERFCSVKIENFKGPALWVIVVDYHSIKNMITSLDVFCHMDSFSGEFTRMLFIGRTVGTIIFAYLADTFGRRIAFSSGLALCLITDLCYYFFTYEWVYFILAFFSVMCFQLYSLITVISVETLSTDLYSTLNGLTGSCFAFSGLTGLFIMYFFKSWFVLLSIHIVVGSVIIYLNFFYLTETPKFALIQKNYQLLDQVLIKIANMNGTHDIVSKRLTDIQTTMNSIRKYSLTGDDIGNKGYLHMFNPIRLVYSIFAPYLKILRSDRDLGNFLKLVIPYITMVFNYYGTLMFIEKIPGDVKFNSLLIFMSELISPILAGQMLKKCSRKGILTVFYIVCIIGALIFINSTNEIILSIVLFVNCFSVCINFVATYLITAETFDSGIKTSALSVLLLIANLPLIFGEVLLSIFPSPFHWIGITSAATIFSISSLKETGGNKDSEIRN
jgi:MFS family permease